MKKLSIAIAVVAGSALLISVASAKEQSISAQNGVNVRLVGDFYNPNTGDIVQKTTPVIDFEGLTFSGGEQVVAGYKSVFKQDVMGMHIDAKVKELKGNSNNNEKQEKILKTLPKVRLVFPELIAFYEGIASATGHNFDDVYLAAWAEEGLFAYEVKDAAEKGIAAMAEAVKNAKGCTAIGWANGIIGQNQDMSVKLAGYGAIWKSLDIIIHAATPLYTAMVLGKNVATVTNTVDNFNTPSLENGAPNSGVAMAAIGKSKSTDDIIRIYNKFKVNTAYSPSFVDKSGKIITIEIQDSANRIIDGTQKGYVVHTNHPVGQEAELVNKYAAGNYKIFDDIAANTLWRYQVAELRAKYSPLQNVDAIKDLLTQKPILMQPRAGNDFVSVNSVIHDLHAGCTYGTTWLSTIQDYTKVCFGDGLKKS